MAAKNLSTAMNAIGGAAKEGLKIASGAIKLMNAKEEESLKKYEKTNEEKRQALDKRLAAGLMTQAQYDSASRASGGTTQGTVGATVFASQDPVMMQLLEKLMFRLDNPVAPQIPIAGSRGLKRPCFPRHLFPAQLQARRKACGTRRRRF